MIVAVAAGQSVHPRAVEDVCESVRRELDAEISLAYPTGRDGMLDLLARTPQDEPIVLCPGAEPDLAELFGTAWPRAGRAVRVDLGSRRRDESPRLAAHIRARGVDGLLWALRSAVHHDRYEFVRSDYGAHADQFGELLMPLDAAEPCPLAVLIHGGYWHDRWELDLMDGLAVDLAQHGIAAWNIEYRRPESHGWAAARDDVQAAVEHVGELVVTHPVDPHRLVVVGHSAGGQLAVRVCADLSASPSGRLQFAGCVSLAGVMDLAEAARRELGERSTLGALGVDPDEDPAVYREGSPLHRVPTGVPTLVVTAEADNRDLNEMSWRYVDAASAAGDHVEHVHGEGGHFTLIDPASDIWTRTRRAIRSMAGSGSA